MSKRLKVYLAGPDVFRPDAAAHGAALVRLCAKWGIDGLYPLDVPLDSAASAPSIPLPTDASQSSVAADTAFGPDPAVPDSHETTTPVPAGSPEDAARIYAANIALIRRSDAVLANLQNFRGHEPDSGTAFEVGYAAALGIPVWAYGVPDAPIVAQVPGDARGCDAQGYLIESFGLPRNLMLACSTHWVVGDARVALTALHRHFQERDTVTDAGRHQTPAPRAAASTYRADDDTATSSRDAAASDR